MRGTENGAQKGRARRDGGIDSGTRRGGGIERSWGV